MVKCDVIAVSLRWYDTILLSNTSGFANESMSKLDLQIRIWIRALNGWFH